MDQQATTKPEMLHNLSCYSKLQSALDRAFDTLNAAQEHLFQADFLRTLPPEGPLFAFTAPSPSYLAVVCGIADEKEHNATMHKLLTDLRNHPSVSHIHHDIYSGLIYAVNKHILLL